jgi:DNA-binding CsgD family transcriptional regulator
MREAELTLDDAEFERMGIGKLVALGRDAGPQDLESLACRGDGAIVRAETRDRFDEARLDSLEWVTRWEHVAEARDRHVYVVEFDAPGLSDTLAERTDELLGTCDPDLDDRGGNISLAGSQDAIAGVVEAYRGDGVSPGLERLGDYEGDPGPMADLTERQREVLETAYDLGFFDVPREATTAEVADAIGVDPSTAAEHLQRAERNLLAHHL